MLREEKYVLSNYVLIFSIINQSSSVRNRIYLHKMFVFGLGWIELAIIRNEGSNNLKNRCETGLILHSVKYQILYGAHGMVYLPNGDAII